MGNFDNLEHKEFRGEVLKRLAQAYFENKDHTPFFSLSVTKIHNLNKFLEVLSYCLFLRFIWRLGT